MPDVTVARVQPVAESQTPERSQTTTPAGTPGPAGTPARTRTVVTTEPVDPALTLAALQRGSGDPVHRRTPDGAVWRGSRTPEGPVTVRVAAVPADGAVEARAWGPGADWLLDRLPALVGAEDDWTGFEPELPLLHRLAKRFAGWRICRTGLVMEALTPAILEQKVTSTEAWRSWRELIWRFSERAPGPVPVPLWIPPDAATLARLPSWEWHRAGVGPQRAETIVRCARVAAALERTAELADFEEVERRLRSLPGVGVWTAAEVMQKAHGHADAVSVGDFHLAKAVGWALAGEPYDDEMMLVVLERWRGHRYRVTKLIELAGIRPPRRGPRFAPRDYRAF
ncbi:DNA-3-methyladenine glycosylase family protein [Actinopolymorpha alba]|uniref:DNA-3-methyladenine glycosylase family protein n=1 Tax=Actinopolymorpha alba TaxID=533267 RepID=UPI00039AB142|nr:DNA-3-methyladenine glycosylase 2 family protein [Actinopolymorpha alba]